MTYGDFLKPWVVVLLRSKMQRTDVARFHRFSDAEGYAQVLRQLNPDRQYIVVFDPPIPQELSVFSLRRVGYSNATDGVGWAHLIMNAAAPDGRFFHARSS